MKRLCVTIVLLGLLWLFASCSFAQPPTVTETDGISFPAATDASTEADSTVAVTNPTGDGPSIPVTIPTETAAQEPADSDFVRVLDYLPDMVVDLKYAGTDNFTGTVIYGSDEAWLRYGTVRKLISVQAELAEHGYYLKLWDGFRPPSAQFKLWEICPDPTYVSDPRNGFSNHSRGNTVDVTLVDVRGNELELPTGFDDFSKKADRDYGDCTPVAAENARLLEQAMEKYGFKGYSGEWWHYTDTNSYEVEHDFIP